MFSTQRECKIYPFSGLKDKSLAREYYIYPASASADFQSYLSSEFDISFFQPMNVLYWMKWIQTKSPLLQF